jgi:hypothetical protein
MVPSSYDYKIQENLSFTFIDNSPLITKHFNFGRLGHNKLYYSTRELGVFISSIFDYELLSSNGKAGTVLAADGVFQRPLEKFYFWEIFLIFTSVLYFIKRKNKGNDLLKLAGGSALLSILIYGLPVLFLLIPFIYFLVVQLIFYVFKQLKQKPVKKILLTGCVFLYIFAIFDFANRLLSKRLWIDWVEPNDYAQSVIWNNLTELKMDTKLVVTDRFGEPAFYYLYYKKIDPDFFYQNKSLAATEINGKIRIEKIGNTNFRSFEYSQFLNEMDQIWVGLPGEFTKPLEGVVDLSGDILVEKYNVNGKDYKMGNEIWIVNKLQ